MKPATVVAATVWLALVSAAASAADARLRAEAGLGGLARPGRWTPVRVAVENGGDAVSGDVVVQWGDARVRRAITLAPGARQRLDLHLRTTEVQDVIGVAIEANGREVSRVDVPVRIVRFDEPLVVCVGARRDTSASATPCNAALTSESAPSSWRGYDAADDVLAEDAAVSLGPEQQRAVDLWRAIRAVEDSGDLLQARDVEPTDTVRPALELGFALYLIGLPAAFMAVRLFRARPFWKYAATSLLVILATSTAFAVGRAGPGSSVAVRYSGVVHRFHGSARSYVLIKGMAEFPSESSFDVRAPIGAGAFESRGVRGARDEQRYDENGAPALAGRFGLGARKIFSFEGDDELALVDVSTTDSGHRVSNTSGLALDDCRVRTGYDAQPIAAIQPGASAEIGGAPANQTRWLTCVMRGPAFNFSASRQSVVNEGVVQLVVELARTQREP